MLVPIFSVFLYGTSYQYINNSADKNTNDIVTLQPVQQKIA